LNDGFLFALEGIIGAAGLRGKLGEELERKEGVLDSSFEFDSP